VSDLITTTIAIALISAMALLGVNYGTQAITTYQASIEAAKIVSDAGKIAAAWRAYARANNGDPTLSISPTDYNCWGSNGAKDLVPNYIATLPVPPQGPVVSTVNYYYPALVGSYGTNGSATKVGPTYTPADSIALQLQSPRVCLAIAALAGYSNASVIASMSGNLGAASTHKPYDCLFVDTAGTGAPAQGDAMLFIYRVFDQNIFSTSARSACS